MAVGEVPFAHRYFRWGYFFASYMAITSSIHVGVMGVQYALSEGPVQVDLHTDFIGSLFDLHMLTFFVAQSVLCLIIIALWERANRAIVLAKEKEIEALRGQEFVESLQQITGILAEHISEHNKDILAWIEMKKNRGHTVAPQLEVASKRISIGLQSLFELAFVYPHQRGDAPPLPQFKMKLESMLESARREKSSYALTGT